MSGTIDELRERAGELLATIGTLRGSIASILSAQAAQLTALYRLEVRRTVTAAAFALAASFFICAAAVLAVLAIVLALWDTHRVLAAALSAAGLALLAFISFLLMRSCTRAPAYPRTLR